MELLVEVRRARRELPSRHRALLDHLNVQETVVRNWPDGVADLYRTLGERPPDESHLATDELRAEGPALLKLLPERFQEAVGADGYARSQIFDEIVATIYTVMINRIRTDGYGVPEFIHPQVFAAFREVIPWPPIH